MFQENIADVSVKIEDKLGEKWVKLGQNKRSNPTIKR